MSSSIQLIVGLANPGAEYANTRHNAGAWVVENLADLAGTSLRYEAKYHGLHALTQVYDNRCHLLIPTTYMNLSGQAVKACMDYHKLSPDMILIAHDDIDLPVGSVKLKYDGGDGGHNGLKDIIAHLHTKQFYRLRIGVGHPRHSTQSDVIDYVLEKPSKGDREKINHAIASAQEILPLLFQNQIQKAMHILHSDNNNGDKI